MQGKIDCFNLSLQSEGIGKEHHILSPPLLQSYRYETGRKPTYNLC